MVYDEGFTSVPNSESGGILNADTPFTPHEWSNIIKNGSVEHTVPEIFDSPPDPHLRISPLHKEWNIDSKSTEGDTSQISNLPEGAEIETPPDKKMPSPLDSLPSDDLPPLVSRDMLSPEGDGNKREIEEETTSPNLRRSTRTRRRPQYFIEGNIGSYKNPKHKIKQSDLNQEFIMGLKWGAFTESLKSADLQIVMTLLGQHTYVDHNTIEQMNPMILGAQANAQDNPTWNQAMNGPYKEEYWKAALLEHKTLIGVDAWETADKEPWMNILPSTWAFKCK